MHLSTKVNESVALPTLTFAACGLAELVVQPADSSLVAPLGGPK
ncbi:MAG TPA: hypothetical protein VIP09_01890 [Dehalococcoidia bacterium]